MSRLVIFDMDGTVVNTGAMIAKTINYVRSQLGLEPMEPKRMLQTLNDPDINSAKYFYGTKHFTAEQSRLFEEYYHENCIVGVELYEGMGKLLKECSREYTLTIATNAHTDFAKRILSHLEVDAHFDLIIGADMVQNPKPHPEMLEKTLGRYSYGKDRTLLIGDSHKDKRAAQAAGIEHVLVNWGFTDHGGSEGCMENIEELQGFLTNLKS